MLVDDLVRPSWPPLRHVRTGAQALDAQEKQTVARRLEDVLARTRLPTGPEEEDRRRAMLRFFAFLAQVETIAIEIPLRFLPHADPGVRPALRRQLVDEVFHSTLFARIAHDLARPAAHPPEPLESAERLLETIRGQPDLGVTATLLNLAAEGWIETLFRHARRWGIADAVFQEVLEDEARHVHEATDYTEDLDLDAARMALEELEQGFLELGSEPSVGLAIVRLAGVDAYRALLQDLHQSHIRHLEVVGLEPSEAWLRSTQGLDAALAASTEQAPEAVADTAWLRFSRTLWTTPRDPTMRGTLTVPLRRVPRRLLTPVFIAAVGRAWAAHPDLNRVLLQDRVWRLPHVNVAVRVLLGKDHLGTVVVAQADRRSVRDITRILQAGVAELQEGKRQVEAEPSVVDPLAGPRGVEDARRPGPGDREGRGAPPGTEMAAWGALGPLNCSVSISNVGRFGIESGSGCFTGPLSPSTDLTLGQRTRAPVWHGVAYLPRSVLPVGALQDHRVFDGQAAGAAILAIKEQMRPKNVKAILRAPDTLPEEVDGPQALLGASLPPGLEALSATALIKADPLVLGAMGVGVAGAAGLGAWSFASHAAGGMPPSPPSPGSGPRGPGGPGGPGSGAHRPAQGPSASGGPQGGARDAAAPTGAAVTGASAGAAAGAAGAAAGGPRTKRTCLARTKQGRPCRNPPMSGSPYCRQHRDQQGP